LLHQQFLHQLHVIAAVLAAAQPAMVAFVVIADLQVKLNEGK
jgi:hypothetical protein